MALIVTITGNWKLLLERFVSRVQHHSWKHRKAPKGDLHFPELENLHEIDMVECV
jgi:hypothetical protein